MTLTLLATLISAAGCLALFRSRAAGPLDGRARQITRLAAWLLLLAGLVAFLGAYSAVKASFIWLGLVSVIGCLVVMIGGARVTAGSKS
jgi:type VI protein secretion system component VasF